MKPVDGKEGPADVCVIELGGTIGTFNFSYSCCACRICYSFVFYSYNFADSGDIESMPFIEALGQFSYRVGKNIVLSSSSNWLM